MMCDAAWSPTHLCDCWERHVTFQHLVFKSFRRLQKHTIVLLHFTTLSTTLYSICHTAISTQRLYITNVSHFCHEKTSVSSCQSNSVFYTNRLFFNVLRHNSPSYLRDLLTIYNPSHNLRSSSHHLLSVGCELFHLRVVTNTLQLLTGTIYRTTLETVALLAFLSINLKVMFLGLPILPSHVSPQRIRITVLLHKALYKFFLYCIVLYRSSQS